VRNLEVLKDEKSTKQERHPNSVVKRDIASDHQSTTDLIGQSIERTTLPERDIMLATVPDLRAFAMSLSGNSDRADDLVQGTLLRAIANINSFESGTNMQAWLFTILRNLFRSEFRKRRREVEDVDGSYVDSLTSAPQLARSVSILRPGACLAIRRNRKPAGTRGFHCTKGRLAGRGVFGGGDARLRTQ